MVINFNELTVGDHVKVRFAGSGRMGGGTITGTLTRIWTPQEHGAGMWQGQVDSGWCFHAADELVEHQKTETA